MRFTKEARTGLLVTVSLVIFFIGFNFLKGSTMFSNEKEYVCYFSTVDGLVSAAGVEIRGIQVGHVTSSALAGAKGVRVTFNVDKNTEVPEGTVAVLAPSDLLGNKAIRLDPGPGAVQIPAGSTLPTKEELGLADNISGQIGPIIHSLKKTVIALDTVLAGISIVLGTENQTAISNTIRDINLTAENLRTLTTTLEKEGGEMSSIVHNTNSISSNLAKNNDTISSILSNVNRVSAELAKVPVKKTFDDLQAGIAQLKDILNKVNSDQGSLGLLIHDKRLYTELNESLVTLQKLAIDIRTHPNKYLNLTVFGKKKKGKNNDQ